MSGEVKLGEADYTVFWETLFQISYVKYPGKGFLMPVFKASRCWKMRKTFATIFFCEYDKTWDLC